MRLALPMLCLAACAVPVEVGGVSACAKDSDCGKFSLCEAQRCVSCPDAGACEAPLNQASLVRNGCRTCTFAPPTQCASDLTCSNSSDFVCVQGSRCVEGCTDLTCCANTCGSKECAAPAPMGCNMDCGILGCALCIAQKCTCSGGAWKCQAMCTSPGFDAGCTAQPVP
jgi:hypothetical protein